MTEIDDHSGANFCADLVRRRDFEKYAASLFVAPEPRRAWLALSAFNVEVSKVRDHVSQPLPGEVRLQWWRDALTGEGEHGAYGAVAGNPVAAELLRAVRLYNLPVETLIRLIDAHVFDVYDDHMPDMAALEAHCRDTSAALYMLRARVLGKPSADIARLTEHAGLAEGLVETMLALPRHASRRQLYLPSDLINLHDVAVEEIFARQASEPLKKVFEHLRGEASRQLDKALVLLRDTPAALRPAFLPLAIVGKMLASLEAADPFNPPSLSRLQMLWILWRAARSPLFKS